MNALLNIVYQQQSMLINYMHVHVCILRKWYIAFVYSLTDTEMEGSERSEFDPRSMQDRTPTDIGIFARALRQV